MDSPAPLRVWAGRRLRRIVDVTIVLVDRDLSVSYGTTAFGLLWAPASILVQVGVLTFVFVRVVPIDVDDYPLFLFSGLVAWHLISSAIGAASGAFTDNRDLVRRPGFPVVVLPMVTTARAFTAYLLAMPVLLAALALSGRLAWPATALPLIAALTLLVVMGPAMVVATINVRHRDVGHLVGVALSVLFYVTPVFYAEGHLPERFRWVVGANPIGWLVTLHRQVLYEGTWPDAGRVLLCAVVAGAGLAGGALLFRRSEAHLADDL
jgi:lipopolysaccharide transport system permease protein